MEQQNLVAIESLTSQQIASICDHTFLNRSEAYRTVAQEGQSPVQLRMEALRNFLAGTIDDKEKLPFAICVRPEDVSGVTAYLSEHGQGGIIVASVAGFPDGSLYDTEFKAAEAKLAILHGAREIDMVLNYDRFKAGDLEYAKNDVKAVVDTAHDKSVIVKLILETSELDSSQIKRACELAAEAGGDFVKTSTGFSASGAKADDLRIMREYFEGGVKISGGVNPENVRELLSAVSGRNDGQIDLNPLKVRIGESSLLKKM